MILVGWTIFEVLKFHIWNTTMAFFSCKPIMLKTYLLISNCLTPNQHLFLYPWMIVLSLKALFVWILLNLDWQWMLLQYTTITLPDLSYDVNQVSQFLHVLPLNIMKSSKGSYDMSKALYITVFTSFIRVYPYWLDTHMQIRHGVIKLVIPPTTTLSFYVETLFHGVPRSILLILSPAVS